VAQTLEENNETSISLMEEEEMAQSLEEDNETSISLIEASASI